MTIQILPVTEPDLPALGALTTASKLALSINKLLWKVWPNEKMQYENCFGAVQNSFKDANAYMFKAVDDATGEIVGSVVITRRVPQPNPEGEGEADAEGAKKEEAPMEVPDKFNPDVFRTVVTSVADLSKEAQGFEHLELTFLVVTQPYRRRGIGRLLMNEAFTRARADNIPIVTQAEPDGYTFFKAIGFQDTKHMDWDLSVWATPFSGFGMFRLAGIVWRP